MEREGRSWLLEQSESPILKDRGKWLLLAVRGDGGRVPLCSQVLAGAADAICIQKILRPKSNGKADLARGKARWKVCCKKHLII